MIGLWSVAVQTATSWFPSGKGPFPPPDRSPGQALEEVFGVIHFSQADEDGRVGPRQNDPGVFIPVLAESAAFKAPHIQNNFAFTVLANTVKTLFLQLSAGWPWFPDGGEGRASELRLFCTVRNKPLKVSPNQTKRQFTHLANTLNFIKLKA